MGNLGEWGGYGRVKNIVWILIFDPFSLCMKSGPIKKVPQKTFAVSEHGAVSASIWHGSVSPNSVDYRGCFNKWPVATHRREFDRCSSPRCIDLAGPPRRLKSEMFDRFNWQCWWNPCRIHVKPLFQTPFQVTKTILLILNILDSTIQPH